MADRRTPMRLALWLILVSLVSTACLAPADDKSTLVYSIFLPDDYPVGTVAIISENDAERINASPTAFDPTGTRFEVTTDDFTIVTTDLLSPADSIEFCFEDPIWVEPPGGERVEVADAGLCIRSWRGNRLPEN